MAKEGKLNRYTYWKEKIRALSDKFGLTEFQVVIVLDNINEFKSMFDMAENSEFIMYFLNGTLPKD